MNNEDLACGRQKRCLDLTGLIEFVGKAFQGQSTRGSRYFRILRYSTPYWSKYVFAYAPDLAWHSPLYSTAEKESALHSRFRSGERSVSHVIHRDCVRKYPNVVDGWDVIGIYSGILTGNRHHIKTARHWGEPQRRGTSFVIRPTNLELPSHTSSSKPCMTLLLWERRVLRTNCQG